MVRPSTRCLPWVHTQEFLQGPKGADKEEEREDLVTVLELIGEIER